MGKGARCPICRRESGTRSILKRGYDTRYGITGIYSVVQCLDCQHGFTASAPGPAEMMQLYEEHYVGGDADAVAHRISPQEQAQRYVGSRIYRVWRSLNGDMDLYRWLQPGRTLNLGCCIGSDLPTIAAVAGEPYGVEPNPQAAQVARKSGYEIHCGTLESSPWPDRFFSNILISQVLEHLYDPVAELQLCERKLAPKGRLVIGCPNVNAFYRRLFGARWAHWHLPFHLHHFTQRSLATAGRRANLRLLRVYTKTPSYWVVMSWRVFRTPSYGQPNLALRKPMPLLERLFWSLPSRVVDAMGQGDSLTAVFEKEG